MDQREINEAVARKMGWKFVPPGPSTSTGYWVREALRDEQGRVIRPKEFPFHSDYCTSIAAAWEVVEKLAGIQGQVTLLHKLNASGNEYWLCSVMDTFKQLETFSTSDTAPMAIAKCFLKLGTSDLDGPRTPAK